MTFKAENMVLPPTINESAWREWCMYRKERKLPLTKSGAIRSINKLIEYPFDVQSAMVDQAIDLGYRGIFPLKKQHQSSNRGFIETHTDSSWAADL